jgi:hypothetical protein
MTSGKRSIFMRALWQSMRGLALLALVLTVGYVLASKSQAPEARLVQPADDDDDDDDGPKGAKAAAAGREEPVVKLEPERQEKGGIETAAPKEIIYQGQARAYGTILPLDRLTSLYNNAISATLQLKSAEIKLAASKTANIRAQNLLKLFPTAASQAELAEATYEMDAAAVDAARAQLEAVSNAAIQEWGPVLGQAIVARSELAEQLVLRKTCLVQLTLQPGATVEPPDRVSVTIGGGSTAAEADFISEATQADPKIPNVSFFYAIPNGPGALVGISVVAMFPNGDAKPGVGIPPSAIIWQAGKPWMYVQNGSDRFERRAIGEEAAPTADGGYVLPAAGWPHDKLIVVAGAQTLLSEESRSKTPSEEDDN